jgi:hypothetical protein
MLGYKKRLLSGTFGVLDRLRKDCRVVEVQIN